MASVAGLDRNTLERVCRQARERDDTVGEPVCQIANALFPSGFVCAGTSSTIDRLINLAKNEGALQAKTIETSGAFHTPLMGSAEDDLSRALDQMLPRMRPPRCSIYFNITAKKVAAGTP